MRTSDPAQKARHMMSHVIGRVIGSLWDRKAMGAGGGARGGGQADSRFGMGWYASLTKEPYFHDKGALLL